MAAAEAEQALLVGLLHHRDDEPPVERDGDADVDVLLVDDVVAVERRVEDGKRPERADDRLGDEREERQLGAVALVLGLLLLAQLRHAREVHLEHRVHVSRRPPAEHHVLGDLLAHHAHRHDLDRLARPERRHVLRRRLDGRRGGLMLDEAEDVLLGHPAADAGPGNRRDVDVVLPGDAAHQRRRTRLPHVLERLDRFDLVPVESDRRRRRVDRFDRVGRVGQVDAGWSGCATTLSPIVATTLLTATVSPS